MNKRQIIIIFSVLALILGGAGIMKLLINMKPKQVATVPKEVLRSVAADTVRYKTIDIQVTDQGRVNPVSVVELVAEASGKIIAEKGSLKVGSRFKKGEVIFSIYKDEAELNLNAQKSRYITAVASLLPDIKIDYADIYDEFNTFFTQIDISKPLPPLPPITHDGLKVLLASRNVLAEYYSIKQMELQLSRHYKVAPFDGMISESFAEEGTFAGTGTRVARFISSKQLEIEVPVDNASAEWISIGATVEIVSHQRNKSWNGSIVRKADFINSRTQSRSVFVSASASKEALLAGEFVDVQFASTPVKNAYELPRTAVFNFNHVYTVVDGKLKKQVINILKTNENSIVFNGLKEGAIVVTEALVNVKENTKVTVL